MKPHVFKIIWWELKYWPVAFYRFYFGRGRIYTNESQKDIFRAIVRRQYRLHWLKPL